MQGVIFIDILMLINSVIGYFTLRLVSFFASRDAKVIRLCLASLLAGLSALTAVWTNVAMPLSILAKLLLAALIIVLAFGFKSTRLFLKTLLYYIVCNVLLGGLVVLLVMLGASGIKYHNFSVYIDISPIFLIFCILLMYLLIRLSVYLFGTAKPALNAQFSFSLSDKTIQGTALIDSGMQLLDAMTGESAVMCSYPAVKRQLDDELEGSLDFYFTLGILQKPFWLVNVNTATGAKMLPATRAKQLVLSKAGNALSAKLSRENIVVVFTHTTIAGGEFDMLVHPNYLQER